MKDGIYRDYSIVTPGVFSTGSGQRKMAFLIISIVTLDAFSTDIVQRKIVFLINSFVTPDAFSKVH